MGSEIEQRRSAAFFAALDKHTGRGAENDAPADFKLPSSAAKESRNGRSRRAHRHRHRSRTSTPTRGSSSSSTTITTTTGTPAKRKAAGELVADAKAAYAAGDAQRAVRLFSDALDTDGHANKPDAYKTYCNRALAHWALDHYADCVADCRASARLNPWHAKAYALAGAALLCIGGRHEEARDEFERGLEYAPDDEKLLKGLARARQFIFGAPPSTPVKRSAARAVLGNGGGVQPLSPVAKCAPSGGGGGGTASASASSS